MSIWEDEHFYILKEPSSIPWLKLFTKEPYKELGDMPDELRAKMWQIYDEIEKQMKLYYNPTKINMASFANMLPQVHIHIMARFEKDSHFPNPMWGEKLRDGFLELADEKIFHKKLIKALDNTLK